MARLASESKMGFYPTDYNTIKNTLNKKFEIEEGTIVLDPCAGNGSLLKDIQNEFKTISYGIELNSLRARELKKNSNFSLNADALSDVRKSPNWTGLLFLNPPYGEIKNNLISTRLELEFFKRYSNTVMLDGYCLLVVNPTSLTKEMVSEIQKNNFLITDVVFDEENEDYRKYNQIILILKKVKRNIKFSAEELLIKIESERLEINELSSFGKYEVPKGHKPNTFKAFKKQDWEIIDECKNSSIKDDFFNESIEKFESSIEIPNEGQSALLIASGKLKNETLFLEIDGVNKEIILKGTVKKEIVTTINEDNEDEDISSSVNVKYTDVYRTVVYGLNMTDGEFIEFS